MLGMIFTSHCTTFACTSHNTYFRTFYIRLNLWLHAAPDGTPLEVSGGEPVLLDGKITLCGRADLDSVRFFSGLLAQLSIFNTTLTAADVANLYLQGISGNA